jgi:DNA-binding transcriptional regulator YdaS (Cro superfamily)
VDVFKLVPNKYITQNEIDASNQVHLDELNVQNQPKITWPANFVVARAYVDQLSRGAALPAQKLSALSAAIDKAELRKDVAPLKTLAASLEKDASTAKTPADADRMRALAGILTAQH